MLVRYELKTNLERVRKSDFSHDGGSSPPNAMVKKYVKMVKKDKKYDCMVMGVPHPMRWLRTGLFPCFHTSGSSPPSAPLRSCSFVLLASIRVRCTCSS